MRDDIFNLIDSMFARNAIGFNRVVPSVTQDVTYPPVNVVSVADGKYLVEMALAGFAREDITISQSSNFLTVEGSKEESKERDYIVRGIAARKFKRQIPIANDVKVISAEMRDGILSISLEKEGSTVKQITVQ